MARILVVEDEPDVRQTLIHNLARAGHELTVAEQGEAALALLRAERPDVVLLALMLPDVSGLELCRTIKRDPTLRSVPIIMLTDASDELGRMNLELGADAYIAKPISFRELGIRLERALRRIERQPAG
jgi:DNA-binding response OmpR family regulator